EVVVADAFALEPQRHRHGLGQHQVAVAGGVLQAVDVGGGPGLQFEQAVGVAVHLVLGGGGQAQQQRVEVGEDLPVLLVDGAVRLVDDDQVEVAGAEAAHPVVGAVDEVHHGGVGRHV